MLAFAPVASFSSFCSPTHNRLCPSTFQSCRRTSLAYTNPHKLVMSLPATFDQLHDAAIASMQNAIAAKAPLIEIQFPPVPNMATAALNQILDANRSFARQLMRTFQGRIPAESTHILFPDSGEASLAAKAWGDVPFNIRALPPKPPLYVTNSSDFSDGVLVVVNPGFNVDEWIKMQNLRGSLPIVTVNADFDKLRGGYYPRIFYPGLHKAYDSFLNTFESVYYLKQFSNGGTLLRAYPEDWTLYYDPLNSKREVIWSGQDRPAFRDVEKLLRDRRNEDLLAR